jgi:hypothetical protein
MVAKAEGEVTAHAWLTSNDVGQGHLPDVETRTAAAAPSPPRTPIRATSDSSSPKKAAAPAIKPPTRSAIAAAKGRTRRLTFGGFRGDESISQSRYGRRHQRNPSSRSVTPVRFAPAKADMCAPLCDRDKTIGDQSLDRPCQPDDESLARQAALSSDRQCATSLKQDPHPVRGRRAPQRRTLALS